MIREYGEFTQADLSGEQSAAQQQELRAASAILESGLHEALRSEDPMESIHFFLKEMGVLYHAQRGYLFERSRDGCYDNTYEWCAQGVEPQIEHLQGIPESAYTRVWWDAFEQHRGYMIDDLETFSAVDPAMAATLSPQGIVRLVVWPLWLSGQLCGFVGFDNPEPEQMEICMQTIPLAASALESLLRTVRRMTYVQPEKKLDELTGLFNTNGFLSGLRGLLKMIRDGKVKTVYALIYLDITHFRVFNSEHGFSEGNRLLKDFADVLRQELGNDRICRSGADHFYACVEENVAEQRVRRVHDRMAAGNSAGVIIRAGIYTIERTPELSESLSVAASQAMDRAKLAADSTRGNFSRYYCRFSPKMESDLTRRNHLISSLDEAIEKNRIRVYYQPVVNTFSGMVCEFEALARWEDPKYGFLNPGFFIGILEEAHIVYKLDLYVLEQVCRDITDRKKRNLSFVPVSVNLSRRDLEHPGIHRIINQMLQRYGLSRAMIHLEITESAQMEGEQLVREHVRRFKGDGYQVWLDDFGGGFSSLNTLQNYDFDTVKVDMLFLRRANQRTPAILSSIVTMCKRLGLHTLTEGVETQQQYDFVRSLGCEMVQGYYVSRPAPLDGVLDVLRHKGIALQTPQESVYFGTIGKSVDVIDSSHPMLQEKGRPAEETALVIAQLQGGQIRTLFANASAREMLGRLGSGSLEEADARSNDPTLPLYPIIRDTLDRAERTGLITNYDFVRGSFIGRIRTKLITSMGDRRAFLINCVNLSGSQEKEEAGRNRLILRNLFLLFHEIWLITPQRNTAEQIYGPTEPYTQEDRTLSALIAHCADSLVLTEERERFLRFLELSTLVERVCRAAGHVLNGYFHLLTEDGSFEWTRVSVAEVSGDGQHQRLLLYTNRNLAVGDDAQPPVGGKESLPAPTAAAGAPSLRERLWDGLLSRADFGIFWKDTQRRFVGVNRTFLRSYNLRLEDVIGRTDEEMNWHLDPGIFQRDEERVLRHGAVIHHAIGECVIQGENHRIAATKFPIYENGKIVGLLGYFLDLTLLEQQMHERDLPCIDTATGLQNHRGLREEGYKYEDEFLRYGHDFAYFAIEIQGLSEFGKNYGTDQQSVLLRQISTALRRCLPTGCVIGRISGGHFGVLAHADSRKARRELEKRITRAITAIHAVGEIPCTLYCRIGSARYLPYQDFDGMLSIAETRMSAQRIHPQEESRSAASFHYSTRTITALMRSYMQVFDIVRLVDPEAMRAMSLDHSGEIFDYPYNCYKLLDKDGRCRKCISLRVIESKKTHEKHELLHGKELYIVSQYVEVDGRPYALEAIRFVHGSEVRTSLDYMDLPDSEGAVAAGSLPE